MHKSLFIRCFTASACMIKWVAPEFEWFKHEAVDHHVRDGSFCFKSCCHLVKGPHRGRESLWPSFFWLWQGLIALYRHPSNISSFYSNKCLSTSRISLSLRSSSFPNFSINMATLLCKESWTKEPDIDSGSDAMSCSIFSEEDLNSPATELESDDSETEDPFQRLRSRLSTPHCPSHLLGKLRWSS